VHLLTLCLLFSARPQRHKALEEEFPLTPWSLYRAFAQPLGYPIWILAGGVRVIVIAVLVGDLFFSGAVRSTFPD